MAGETVERSTMPLIVAGWRRSLRGGAGGGRIRGEGLAQPGVGPS